MTSALELFAIPGLPDVQPGDDLGALIHAAVVAADLRLRPGDILAVAQKIVSKSENRFVRMSDLTPSSEALEIAAQCGKDPRKVEAILRESTAILRVAPIPPDGLIVARHRQGWICANAGIDESNLGLADEGDWLLLLPEDPDASARRLRQFLEAHFGGPLGVVITDTFGRPFRQGLVNVAIGLAGVRAVVSLVGEKDAYGRTLRVSQPAFADEIAAASGLLMGKAARTPVIVLRGLAWTDQPDASARAMLRPLEQELFL